MAPGEALPLGETLPPGGAVASDESTRGARAAAQHTGESHDDAESQRPVEAAAAPGGAASAETEAATTHEAALERTARDQAAAEDALAGSRAVGHGTTPAPAVHRPATVGVPAIGAAAVAPAATLIDSTQIRRAVAIAEKRTDLKWSVFVGTLGTEPRAQAEARHAALGPAAVKAVLIAVDPVARRLEIVTGEEARAVLDDRSCALAAASMTSTFAVRDLDGGIAYGILALVEHVRRTR